jgi:hypothetical protein
MQNRKKKKNKNTIAQLFSQNLYELNVNKKKESKKKVIINSVVINPSLDCIRLSGIGRVGSAAQTACARRSSPPVRRRGLARELAAGNQDLSRADYNLFIVGAIVVSLLDNEREEDDAHNSTAGLELFVGELQRSTPLTHHGRVKLDSLYKLAVCIIFRLEGRQHHVLGLLCPHLD